MQFRARNHCLFCRNTKLTDEHVFPRWYGDRVQDLTSKRVHHLDKVKIDTQDIAVLKKVDTKIRNGDLRRRRLRVVCAPCNNGWMSNIQSRMKIIYDKIEKGKMRFINEEDQNIIALWAIVFSIVYETNHPEWAFTTFDDRVKIKERLAPTSDWLVWVAGYEGRTDWSNHFGLQTHLFAREVGTVQWHNVHMQNNHRMGIQVTSWPFSSLFFMTCFKSPEIVDWPRTVEIDNGANLIYPKGSPTLDVSKRINILEADKISRIILQIRESDSRRIWGAGPAPITPEKDQDPK